MKLSKNLSLNEMLRSETAKRKGIENLPNENHIENMRLLAENVFQPIRACFRSPIYISSGFRSEKLNIAIGGSETSQHCEGEAMDIDNDYTSVKNVDIFNFIRNNLDFDQLIWEYGDDKNPAWVHVSYKKTGNRREVLRVEKKNGKTKYYKI